MLSKHFQRQVKALRVFCRHEDRGCGWQGELSDLEHHAQSCPMRDAPLMTDLPELYVSMMLQCILQLPSLTIMSNLDFTELQAQKLSISCRIVVLGGIGVYMGDV